jgi:pheromone shutdown protein TraB
LQFCFIGTAHVSNKSAEIVKSLIPLLQPEKVFIELDESRLNRFSDEMTACYPHLMKNHNSALDKVFASVASGIDWGELTVRKILRRLGHHKELSKMENKSGGEFKAAIYEAKRCNAGLILGDQALRITQVRTIVAFKNSLSMLLEVVNQPLSAADTKTLDAIKSSSKGKIRSKEEYVERVEKLNDRNKVDPLFRLLQRKLPLIYDAVIGERDQFMAEGIAQVGSTAKIVVAVVGLGHVAGMERRLVKMNYRLIGNM